jgi:dTDP-4-amino-4,6-dideoxygalactose transaminase
MAGLKDGGIQSSIHYPPFWSFEAYSHFKPEDTPLVARLIGREPTLPLYPTMSDDDVHMVVDTLHRTLATLARPAASSLEAAAEGAR